MRVDQVIAGLAIVFLCQGLTGLISAQQGWTNRTIGGLSSLPIWPLSEIPDPRAHPLPARSDRLPDAAAVLRRHLDADRGPRSGCRLRAVGENPGGGGCGRASTSRSTGCAPSLAGAALVGLAGGYLSVAVAKIWVDGMSGGRGWIAIALVIFARWYPWRALAGALLFGCIEALIPRIAAVGLQVPQYFMLMTPYLATIAVMIWTSLSGKARLERSRARWAGRISARSGDEGQALSLGTPG